jgi:hypothetical protein
MKRLLALLAGGLGLGALLRRRGRPAFAPSPADDLRAKLEAAKGLEVERDAPEPGETVESPAGEPPDVDSRRADAHARARQTIDELGENS